jgi:hypothetical protein
MKPRLPIQSFLRWTIFIFLLLVVSGRIQQRASVAIGSHLSSEYAQWDAQLHQSANAIRTKDPDGWLYVTSRVGYSIFGMEAITAAIISVFIVWWRRDSRGMPNTALEPTAAAPSVSRAPSNPKAGNDSASAFSGGGSALDR